MYTDHFGINENPFSIAPDPRYIYMSEGHREAYAHLLYGIKGDSGFVLLSGEVGTGKTTICRCLLEQIPENSNIAIIFNPKVTAIELLASICDEFDINYPQNNSSIKVFIDKINAYLLAANARGEKTVLIIDEAQNLEIDVLEQIRLLTNLETNQHKLLQIIMLGQPELLEKLSRPNLRQLAQRITARYHIGPLSKKEIGPYVTHRLTVAGFNNQIFPASSFKKLYNLTGGIPRLINILCDRALLGVYVQGAEIVSKSILKKAAKEIFGTKYNQRYKKTSRLALSSLLALIVGGAALAAATLYKYESHQPIHKPAQIKHPIDVNTEDQQLEPLTSQANLEVLSTPDPSNISDPILQNPVQPPTSVSSETTSLNWPSNQPQVLSQETSYKALFAQWGFSYTPEKGVHACRQAEAFGLRCLHMQGGLTSLLRLNRPAILQLFDHQQHEYYGTLIKIQNQTATIQLGEDLKKIPLQDIAKQWYGHYVLLWRPPPAYQNPVTFGNDGELVQWLSKELMRIFDQSIQTGNERHTFNDQLLNQVKKLQFDAGLVPDGVVGPQTLIHLNTVSGSDVPTLIESNKDG